MSRPANMPAQLEAVKNLCGVLEELESLRSQVEAHARKIEHLRHLVGKWRSEEVRCTMEAKECREERDFETAREFDERVAVLNDCIDDVWNLFGGEEGIR